jgi:hypothetical protein
MSSTSNVLAAVTFRNIAIKKLSRHIDYRKGVVIAHIFLLMQMPKKGLITYSERSWM